MKRGDKGAVLFLVVVIIALAAILIASTTLFFIHSVQLMQYRIDRQKAYYLAQAGVMKSLQDWRVSSGAEANRRYGRVNQTVTGNQIFKTGAQADFAYHTFDVGERSGWTTVLGRSRFQQFRIRNISTTESITFTAVYVTWASLNPANPVGANNLNSVNLQVGPTGDYVGGANTYIEWTNAFNAGAPILLTIQWWFADDSGTVDSKTHEIVAWNGAPAAPGAASAARPATHTFCIHSTGQVNQSGGSAFKVLEPIRAAVSGTPGGGDVEIVDWDKMDKSIP